MRRLLSIALLVLAFAADPATAQQAFKADAFIVTGGGTIDSTAGDIPGTNITISGTWPKQTINASSGGSSVPGSPQGRLTLVTATPVLISDQTAKSQIFYDCYKGIQVPYYTGAADAADTIASCEVSLTMATSSTGVTNSGGVFDIWWVHGGASRVCVATNGSGGGWASDTAGSNIARGTGYSQVHNTRGYWTNVNSLTHCYNGATDYGAVSADQATYLGTVYTTAAGQTGMAFKPAAATGGTNNFLGLYNAYNRVPVSSISRDSTVSWTYALATWRSTNASNSNRVSFVDGLQQSEIVSVTMVAYTTTVAGGLGACGADLDSTSAAPTTIQQGTTAQTTNALSLNNTDRYLPQLGFHFIQEVESASTATTNTFFANGYQALIVSLQM